MTRILLACGIGASTGFMAANMRKAAKAQGLDVSIHAVSKSQVPEYADKIDVLLLGPHFSAEVPKYKEMLKDHNVKVTSIDPDDYAACVPFDVPDVFAHSASNSRSFLAACGVSVVGTWISTTAY